MLDWIVQAAIMITGGGAIALLAFENPRVSRWGWLCGFISAPLWLYAMWPLGGNTGNWGVFVLSVWYTVHWTRGTWTFLLKRRST